MKRKALAALFVSFVCAVGTIPTFAQTLYSNFGPNTDTGGPLYAYGVYGSGQAATDSFLLGSNATVTSADLVLWAYTMYVSPEPSWDVNWLIGTTAGGSQVATGTDVTPTSSDFINTVVGGSYYFNVYSVTIPIPDLALNGGTTYWLTLYDTTNNGDGASFTFWDASWPAGEGPSTAYNTNSLIPSESFKLFGPAGSTSVPEYSPFDLPAVIGVLAVALLFRKRFAPGGIRHTT